jgi:hypothetical protein
MARLCPLPRHGTHYQPTKGRQCKTPLIQTLRRFSGASAGLARSSHRVLNLAKPRSSKEAPRRARKARPRPGRERNAGDQVSAHQRTFPPEHLLVFPRLGAVLPQPGFLIHLPSGEKSVQVTSHSQGLHGYIGLAHDTRGPGSVRYTAQHSPRRTSGWPEGPRDASPGQVSLRASVALGQRPRETPEPCRGETGSRAHLASPGFFRPVGAGGTEPAYRGTADCGRSKRRAPRPRRRARLRAEAQDQSS